MVAEIGKRDLLFARNIKANVLTVMEIGLSMEPIKAALKTSTNSILHC